MENASIWEEFYFTVMIFSGQTEITTLRNTQQVFKKTTEKLPPSYIILDAGTVCCWHPKICSDYVIHQIINNQDNPGYDIWALWIIKQNNPGFSLLRVYNH